MKLTILLTSAALALSPNAYAQTIDRTVLPVPPAPFDGMIAEEVSNSVPGTIHTVEAPDNAPNVLVIMTDDVGFGTSAAFGGPVPTPALEALSEQGVRYNRFHTTGICSPSRAALLTGRNSHNAGNGYLSIAPNGFPGYEGQISRSTATIAEILKYNNYNTAMFGKHHNVPYAQDSAVGPFDAWPIGMGFEYFYGWIGGDVDQYSPNLFRGIDRVPESANEKEMLDKRLADDAIRWIHNQKAAAPDKPFFIYYAPGTMHAPHQAPQDWIARFKGQFDQGWDTLREQIHRRQLAAGIIPKGTKLTPRPKDIPAWDSLSEKEKKYSSRMMEVAAATLSYQDHQIGRIINELDRMGLRDDTLIIFIEGDNGASAEAGPEGSLNEIGDLANQIEENADWFIDNMEEMGGPRTYQNYPAGWSWALVSPLVWTKQYASYLGGIRNGMVVSWPEKLKPEGSVCNRFSHLVDIAPTILDVAGLPAPREMLGVKQKPMDGFSIAPTFTSCAGTVERTQYFEIGGKIGLYHNGWFANRDDGRVPWKNHPPEGGESKWELYNLDKDFSQSTDLAAKHPQKLEELKQVWQAEAKRNNVYPIDHTFGAGRKSSTATGQSRKRFDYWGADTSVSFGAAPRLGGKSFIIEADVTLDSDSSAGAILATGSWFGGWSFFLDYGIPTVVHALSTKPSDVTRISGNAAIPAGKAKITYAFASDGGPRSGGTITIRVNGHVMGQGHIPKTIVRVAGLGEHLDIGRDTGVPVVDYGENKGRFSGTIEHVVLSYE